MQLHGDLELPLEMFFNNKLCEDQFYVEYCNTSQWVWKGLPLKTMSICVIFSLQEFAQKYKLRITISYLIAKTD